MADLKISELNNLTGADPILDMLPIVDVSATPPASGSTKRISINNILGASGTATLASATITGAATVGTTLGVTGASTLASVGVTGAATVGTTLLVGTNATLTNGNVIIGTSGKGIDFSATASGSGTMTSELLDDYEEGTWVGTLKGGTTDPTIAVTSTGRYTKVGRLVTLQISFSNVITTGASGGASISGVPFTNTNITVHGSAASYSALTFSGYLGSEIDANGIDINLFDVRSNNTWTPALHNAGITRYINAEITYTV